MLPQQPLDPTPQQQTLTTHLLLPQQTALHAFWQHMRQQADEALRPRQPHKSGKPYPLGQCLEISRWVFNKVTDTLRKQDAPLNDQKQLGRDCLAEFVNAGGQLRMIWGALRGQYFQNAILLGSLYVDVANDTVFREKPPVEIRPFHDCGLIAIRDFFHFAKIARRYWGGELYPNHLFPNLAPWFPWISVVPGTGLQLEAGNDYMIALSRADGFRSAQQVLEQPAPPAILAEVISPLCSAPSWGFCADGQSDALARCDALRQTPPDTAQRDQAVRQFLAINQRLAQIAVRKGPATSELPRSLRTPGSN